MRYYRAFLRQQDKSHQGIPEPFIDLRLSSFGMGKFDLDDVPAFKRLYSAVQDHQFDVVYLDLDEINPALTPDYESAFVRNLLESSGAAVLNAYTDDQGVFLRELNERCGQNAREHEITDVVDFVTFFPSVTSDVTAHALYKELELPVERQGEEIQRILARIDALKRLRPYSGGGIPFVEDRLSAEWRKSTREREVPRLRDQGC
jgi:hypothetical protein